MLRLATPSRTCRPTKSTALFQKYPDSMETYMKRPTGSHRLYLASSVTDKALVANSERRLREVVTVLEGCREALADGGEREASQLVSVAILQVKMKLNRIA